MNQLSIEFDKVAKEQVRQQVEYSLIHSRVFQYQNETDRTLGEVKKYQKEIS